MTGKRNSGYSGGIASGAARQNTRRDSEIRRTFQEARPARPDARRAIVKQLANKHALSPKQIRRIIDAWQPTAPTAPTAPQPVQPPAPDPAYIYRLLDEIGSIHRNLSIRLREVSVPGPRPLTRDDVVNEVTDFVGEMADTLNALRDEINALHPPPAD